MPVKNWSSAPTGLPVRGSRTPLAVGAMTLIGWSVPFERPLLPFIYEADGEDAKEDHHRPEAIDPDLLEGDRPGKQKADFEVENDEEDRDQIETHIKFHARIVECIEAALIGGE